MLQTEFDIKARLQALEEGAEKRRTRQFDSLSYRDASAGHGRLQLWLSQLRAMASGTASRPRRRISSRRAFVK